MNLFISYLFGFFYLFIGLLFSIFSFYLHSPILIIFDLFYLLSFEVFNCTLIFDTYSLVYISILSYIVSSVHFFIYSYMGSELNLIRFIIILNSFVFFMFILIISANLISFILGWDGLGFTSFILVSWFGCSSSRSASLKTFLINRLGDSFFLISLPLFIIQGHFGFLYFDYFYWFYSYILLIVAFTKSAQFPFSSWLPDAMSAPTPVSALVHSSTLVTAGIYLIFRFSYSLSPIALEFIQLIGFWTMILGSFGSCFDYNSKKVIAYSTLSQLGMMSYCLSLGLYNITFYLMMSHALFKALLFISIGNIIQVNNHFQDIRLIGNVLLDEPLILFSASFSLLSLSGYPFLSGFYLKDYLIAGFFVFNSNCFSSYITFSSLILTIIYSLRLIKYMSFYFNFSSNIKLSTSVSLNSYWILFFAVHYFGIYFYNQSYEWLNISSSWLTLIYLSCGIFISLAIIYEDLIVYYISFGSYSFLMFYLTILTYTLNSFYSIGDSIYNCLDHGYSPLSFIDSLDNLFSSFWNNIISSSFLLNWIYIFSFSIFLLFTTFILYTF